MSTPLFINDSNSLFAYPAHIEPPITNTQVTYIGDVIAIADSINVDKDINLLNTLRPELFYQGRAVTPTHPAPFNNLPSLNGYQHFTG